MGMQRHMKRFIFAVVFLFFLYEINSIVILLFGIHVLPVVLLVIGLAYSGFCFLFKRHMKFLNTLKLIRLYVFLALTACLSGIVFYLSHGIFRWSCGLLGMLLIYLIISIRRSDFKERGHRQGVSFLYFFALVSMILLLVVNEYHYSLDVKRIKRKPKPDESKTAVALTFDDVGLEGTDPRSLTELAGYLSERGIPATFFVAAKGLEESVWIEPVKSLLNQGMEIGFHGYSHRFYEFGRMFYSFNSPSYEVQKEIFIKSLNLFREKIGIKPDGFRAPVWRENRFTLQLLEEFGFKYNSGRKTLLTSQVPFFRRSNGKISNIVNISSSGEFTWFYGPKWFKAYQYFINKQLVRLLLKRQNSTFGPHVLVFHLKRLKDEFADRLFKEIVDWIVQNEKSAALSLNVLAEKLQAARE
jgi:peptidoglycan/xylan/chitin deacetylase (PgdA/CDA1 family)